MTYLTIGERDLKAADPPAMVGGQQNAPLAEAAGCRQRIVARERVLREARIFLNHGSRPLGDAHG